MPYAGQVDKTMGAETVGHLKHLLETELRRAPEGNRPDIARFSRVDGRIFKPSIVVRHLFESKPITPEVLASYDEAVAGELKRLTRILFVEKFAETKEFKKNKEIAQYLQAKLGALVGPGPLQEIVTMAYNEVGTTAPYMTAAHWERFVTIVVDRLRELEGDTVAAKAEKEWRGGGTRDLCACRWVSFAWAASV